MKKNIIFLVIFSVLLFSRFISSGLHASENSKREVFEFMKMGVVETSDAIFTSESPSDIANQIVNYAKKNEGWAQYALADLSILCNTAAHYSVELPSIDVIIERLEYEYKVSGDQGLEELIHELKTQGVNFSAKEVENIEQSKLINQKCNNLNIEFLSNEKAQEMFAFSSKNGYSAAKILSAYYEIANDIDVDDAIDLDIPDIERDLININFADALGEDFHFSDPNAIYTIAEFSPYIFNSYSRFSNREAWVLAACELGFNNNCEDKNGLIALRFCNVMDDCDSAKSIQEAFLLRNGKKQYAKYKKIAQEIIAMYKEQNWEKLGL